MKNFKTYTFWLLCLLVFSACQDEKDPYVGNWLGIYDEEPVRLNISKSDQTYFLRFGGSTKTHLASLKNGRLSGLENDWLFAYNENSGTLVFDEIELVSITETEFDKCACWLRYYANYHQDLCQLVFDQHQRVPTWEETEPIEIPLGEFDPDVNLSKTEDSNEKGELPSFKEMTDQILGQFCIKLSEDSTKVYSSRVKFVTPDLIGMANLFISKEDYSRFVQPYEEAELKLGKSVAHY
ncbi:MAG: hypothetical protein GC178_13620 [Flavobacteriales bacterium]|nr:hypothetical protein [Flavobacteriales bacterium]